MNINSSNVPDWFIDEAEKMSSKDYWINAVNYFCSYYNNKSQIQSNEEHENTIGVVDRGIKNIKYLVGKQENINYNHMVEDGMGNTLQPLWVNSKKVKSLTDRLAYKYSEYLNNKVISANTISERAENEKIRRKLSNIFKYDNRFNFINEELQKMGVEFIPPNDGQTFKNIEDANKWLSHSYLDTLEIYAKDIGEYVEWINSSDMMYINSFINDYCTSNLMAIYTLVENGVVKQKRIPFYNLIYDYTSNDPFMRDARFCGYVEYLPVVKVLSDNTYNLSDIDRDKLYKCSKDHNSWNDKIYKNGGIDNLKLFSFVNNEPTVSVVTMFWSAPRDTKYSNGEDKYGNKVINKSVNSKKVKSDYIINDLHRAVVIAGEYLVNNGYENNVLRHIDDKRNVVMPISVLNSNSTLGDGIPIIGMISDLVSKMDLYETKISESVGKSKGKCHVFVGNELNKGVSDIITNLSTMGIDVIVGTSGEVNDSSGNGKIVHSLDMTLDPNITAYIQLSSDLERKIEDLMNLPKIARGISPAYIGMGVQRNTASLANEGNGNMWNNLMHFNNICLSNAINMARFVIADKKSSMNLFLGERGELVLNELKDTLFEDLFIRISVNDVISENNKQLLSQIMLGKAQRGEIMMGEVLAIIKADSFTELENVVKYYEDIRMRANQQVPEQEAIQQEFILNQKRDLELTKRQMMEEGMNKRNDNTVRGGIIKESLKVDGKNKANNEIGV